MISARGKAAPACRLAVKAALAGVTPAAIEKGTRLKRVPVKRAETSNCTDAKIQNVAVRRAAPSSNPGTPSVCDVAGGDCRTGWGARRPRERKKSTRRTATRTHQAAAAEDGRLPKRLRT